MGIDALDMAFRIEKAFQIKWTHADYDRCWNQRRDTAAEHMTVADIHAFVCTLLQEQRRPIPPSSWHRVQKVLAEVTGTRVQKVCPDSRLKADLGFC